MTLIRVLICCLTLVLQQNDFVGQKADSALLLWLTGVEKAIETLEEVR